MPATKNKSSLNIPYLFKEINDIIEKGVKAPKILVSDRAQILMPYHILGNHKYDLLKREYLLKDVKEPSNELINQWKSLIKVKCYER